MPFPSKKLTRKIPDRLRVNKRHCVKAHTYGYKEVALSVKAAKNCDVAIPTLLVGIPNNGGYDRC